MKKRNKKFKRREKMKTTLVVLNMNNKELLKDCLNSVQEFTDGKFSVIIVENGSDENHIEYSRRLCRNKEELIVLKKNEGFCGGMNAGIRQAMIGGADYIVLVSNDIKFFKKDWLNELIKTAESNNQIGVVGGKLIYSNGDVQTVGGKTGTLLFDEGEKKKLTKSEEKFDKVKSVKYVMGALILIKREVIEKIGYFDMGFHPIYGEEIDFEERVRKNDYRIFYTPNSIVVHKRCQTTNPKKITLHWYYSKKNSIRLELLNYNIKEIIKWQMIHLGAVFLGKEKGKIFFRLGFPYRLCLLIKAYSVNLKNIQEIMHKRNHRGEKIW